MLADFKISFTVGLSNKFATGLVSYSSVENEPYGFSTCFLL